MEFYIIYTDKLVKGYPGGTLTAKWYNLRATGFLVVKDLSSCSQKCDAFGLLGYKKIAENPDEWQELIQKQFVITKSSSGAWTLVGRAD
jgi:hypothetical protein